MEKNNTDSMTTVQMKADYAASEIYSTASEAPPAYPMREASSVKIAKIIAMTVILASLIIGSFMLGSTYLQARASCDQMQALDSMLEKELMLETLQQELPKAEALLQSADNDNADDDVDEKANNKKASAASELSDSETSYTDNDESADLNRGNGVNVKMPLELNLSELAHAIMQNNQKSRMNCVIERRQAEEIIDDNSLTFNGEPKKRVTGERMAIFCESGTESKTPVEPQAEQIPAIMMRPVTYGHLPQQFPLTHMPMQSEQQRPIPSSASQSNVMQRLFPQQFIVRQIHLQPQQQPHPEQSSSAAQPSILGPFRMGGGPSSDQQQHGHPQLVALRFNVGPPPQQPEQVLTAPRPMMPMMPMSLPDDRPVPYQIRNELLQLQKQERERELQQQQPPMQQQQPPQPMHLQLMQHLQPQQQPQQGGVQMQRVPLSLALQRVGITPDDLRNIQRMAEERIQQEVQQLNHEFNHMHEVSMMRPAPLSSSSSSGLSSYSDSDSEPDSSDESSAENEPSTNANNNNNGDSNDDEDSSPILQIGRTAFGRSVVRPISIPVNLMQAIKQAENMEQMVAEGKAHAAQVQAQAQAAQAQAGDAEHRAMNEERPNEAEDALSKLE